MNEAFLKDSEVPEELNESWNMAHPLGRMRRPEEVGALIVFLAADEASFITEQGYVVDVDRLVRGE